MATSRPRTEEPPRVGASIELYEACIESLVRHVLEHGRPLVGLEPLPAGEGLTDARVEAEADAAEAFVRTRVVQTGLGFLTMVLDEDEWLVFGESHQAPHRHPAPLTTAYDRFKATARHAIQSESERPRNAESADERVVHAGAKRRRTRTAITAGDTVRG